MTATPLSHKGKSVFLLLGALLAISKNSGKSFKTSFDELYAITDIPHLQISSALRRLAASGQLVFIVYEDDIYVHITPFISPLMELINGD